MVVVGVVEDVVVDGVVVLVETAVVVAIDCVVVGATEDVVSSLLEPHATTNEIPSRPIINLSPFDISNGLAPTSRIIHGELTTIWIEAQLPATFVCFMVMSTAKRNQVLEIGRPAVFPIVNMVNRTMMKRHGATIYCTGFLG